MRTPLWAAIVHYRTPDLIQRAVEAFRQFHPDVPLLLIDNGSTPESAGVLYELIERHGPGEVLLNSTNLHHGPAMDQAVRHLEAPLILLLDSDAIVIRAGLLERLHAVFDGDPRAYAAGTMTWMDARGFDLPRSSGGHPYIRPICMMLRREVYRVLPPFERHGAPCLRNMIAAAAQGYQLVDVPVLDYITHEGRGTAARHGYGLGLRGRLNHLLHRLGL